MSAPAAYVPCQCPKCAHRPVYGVCRCRVCKGETPQEIRSAQSARMTELATNRAVALLQLEDTRPLTDEEALELEEALVYLTRN